MYTIYSVPNAIELCSCKVLFRANVIACDISEKYETQLDVVDNSTGEIVTQFCNGMAIYVAEE